MGKRRAIVGALIGGWFLLGLASVAAANQPLIDRTFHDAGMVEIADCGSFSVLDDFELFSTVILFFDDQGHLTRFVEQNYGTDAFSNSVTGKALKPMHFHNTVLVDRVDRIASTNGIVFRYVVPGAGAILLDVGRIVTDHGQVTFEAGPHQFFDGDLAGLCAALQ